MNTENAKSKGEGIAYLW